MNLEKAFFAVPRAVFDNLTGHASSEAAFSTAHDEAQTLFDELTEDEIRSLVADNIDFAEPMMIVQVLGTYDAQVKISLKHIINGVN